MKYFVDKEEEAFITIDGRKLYTLQDLLIWLYMAPEKDFRYHVNERENHFVDWIKNSLGIEELALRIKEVKNRDEMINIIKKYLEGKVEEIEII